MKLKKISRLFLILILFSGVFLFLAIVSSKNFSPIKIVNNKPEKLDYQHPPIPEVTNNNFPNVGAESFIIIDNATNTILLSKNSNLKIYPASTTKLATALTALNIYPLDEVVDVTQKYNDGKIMDLQVGEKITVKSLVSALLVYSANDSAFNLASHHTDGIPGFIKEMNQMLQKYGLKDTNFVNFDGLHDPNHYSTVYDLSQLGRIAIKNPIIKDVVKTKNITVTDVDKKIFHELTSTNELLGVVPEIEGLKTGWTPEAGGCFIGLVNINGHYLITVVAQSPDRFADTKELINWSKQNIDWHPYSI
jgi:serine-type D-Ala-D-Ala carboxypeptidase (penicillin-binding protein 5/6)